MCFVARGHSGCQIAVVFLVAWLEPLAPQKLPHALPRSSATTDSPCVLHKCTCIEPAKEDRLVEALYIELTRMRALRRQPGSPSYVFHIFANYLISRKRCNGCPVLHLPSVRHPEFPEMLDTTNVGFVHDGHLGTYTVTTSRGWPCVAWHTRDRAGSGLSDTIT